MKNKNEMNKCNEILNNFIGQTWYRSRLELIIEECNNLEADLFKHFIFVLFKLNDKDDVINMINDFAKEYEVINVEEQTDLNVIEVNEIIKKEENFTESIDYKDIDDNLETIYKIFINLFSDTTNTSDNIIDLISSKDKCTNLANAIDSISKYDDTIILTLIIKLINVKSIKSITNFIMNIKNDISKIGSAAYYHIDNVKCLFKAIKNIHLNYLDLDDNAKNIITKKLSSMNEDELVSIYTLISSLQKLCNEIIEDVEDPVVEIIEDVEDPVVDVNFNKYVNFRSVNRPKELKLSEINTMREEVVSKRETPTRETKNLILLEWITNLAILDSVYPDTSQRSEVYRILNNELIKAMRFCDITKEMQFSIVLVDEQDAIQLVSVTLPSVRNPVHVYDGRICITISYMSCLPTAEYSGTSVINSNI